MKYVRFLPTGVIEARPRNEKGQFTPWQRVPLGPDLGNNVGRHCSVMGYLDVVIDGRGHRRFRVVAEYNSTRNEMGYYIVRVLDLSNGQQIDVSSRRVTNLY